MCIKRWLKTDVCSAIETTTEETTTTTTEESSTTATIVETTATADTTTTASDTSCRTTTTISKEAEERRKLENLKEEIKGDFFENDQVKCAEGTTAPTISKEAEDIVRKLFDKVKHNYFNQPTADESGTTTATTEVTLFITNIHSATRIVHRLHDNSCSSRKKARAMVDFESVIK